MADNIIILNKSTALKVGKKEEMLDKLNTTTSCAKLEGKHE